MLLFYLKDVWCRSVANFQSKDACLHLDSFLLSYYGIPKSIVEVGRPSMSRRAHPLINKTWKIVSFNKFWRRIALPVCGRHIALIIWKHQSTNVQAVNEKVLTRGNTSVRDTGIFVFRWLQLVLCSTRNANRGGCW